MFVVRFMFSFLAICASLATAEVTPLYKNLEIRNAGGASSAEVSRLLRRSLYATTLNGHTVHSRNTSLDRSWDGVTLLKFTGLRNAGIETGRDSVALTVGAEVVCTTCYIKGLATARFTIDDNFDFVETFQNYTSEFTNEIENLVIETFVYVNKVIETTENNTNDGFDLDDVEFPPVDFSFDLNLHELPDCQLEFQFDSLELYMAIDTKLLGGVTYTINIFQLPSPLVLDLGDDLELGVIFTVDLILSVETEIEISNGFHISLNDGAVIQIPIFGQNVSKMTSNGGNFEFLDVTIASSEGVILTAILRVGLKAVLDLSPPTDDIGSPPTAAALFDISLSAQTGVWLDIAKFKTSIVAPTTKSLKEACKLAVIAEYEMGLGANAGAMLAIGSFLLGAELKTETIIYKTTFSEVCAISKNTEAVSAVATIIPRDDESTTTEDVVYRATGCLSTGLVNCPASLQTIIKNTVAETLTGAEAIPTWANVVTSTIPFKTNAQKLISMSGIPTEFTPAPSPTVVSGDENGDGNIFAKETGGVSNKIIIGVSVGVGLPVLIGIMASLFCLWRRKQSTSVKSTESMYQAEQVSPMPGQGMSGKKSATVAVAEYQ
ncbi:hypothetical protein VTL71DRAFT_11225 [Oculimacula yallundae]|uniref:Mid2 domain-containing protein n=1 Tax=Oculimacula yallundae TaxID=86028 RepID=A0ABR4CVC9_9HELO